MKCFKCKFLRCSLFENKCELFGFYNFYEYFDEECPWVGDDYIIKETCEDLGITKGEDVSNYLHGGMPSTSNHLTNKSCEGRK